MAPIKVGCPYKHLESGNVCIVEYVNISNNIVRLKSVKWGIVTDVPLERFYEHYTEAV